MDQERAARVGEDELREAAHRIEGRVHKTPLLSSRSLGERVGAEVYLKAECLQKAGSFKARGAFNKALSLSDEERRRGLLTYSSGNHGQAVAYVAASLGVPALIVMPVDAPRIKREACLGYGAEVVLHGTRSDQRRARALELQEQRGASMIPPFDDRWIIAGQGTVGLELLAQSPAPPDVVIAPIGGGGLISGLLAATRPGCRVIGVEPFAACAMTRSLAAGRPTDMHPEETIADGLKPTRPGELNFLHAKELGLETVLVDDDEIRAAMRFLYERARLVVEPSGAATTAALLAGKVEVSGRVVALVSGGNVDPALFAEVIAPGRAS